MFINTFNNFQIAAYQLKNFNYQNKYNIINKIDSILFKSLFHYCLNLLSDYGTLPRLLSRF